MDAKLFDESIVYKGKGSAENNLLAKRILEDEKYYSQNIYELNEADFAKFLANKKQDDFERVNNKKLDPNFVIQEKMNSENSLLMFQSYYSKEKARQELYVKMNNSPSPSFDYINYNGGKTKLEDFKGKYVYIDVWATWCGPCRAEIPFLQKVEEKYQDKKIAFVSVSIDQQKDFEKWKAFVKGKSLGGIQLFADKDSDFIKSYNITGIPRFILIDPNGIIVKADASRPSDLELQKELDSLLN
jgi:thiol-disulfide isomerase/thioredoxin